MTEADRLRQEAAAWKAEAERAAVEIQALRLQLAEREKLGVEQANILRYWEENEALKKRLESATDFDFGRYTIYRSGDAEWLAFVGGKCAKCLLGKNDANCRFDTFEEAEAAARKALEVAG